MAGVTALKRPVDADMIEHLRDLLGQAERGEVSGVVVLANFPGACYQSNSSGDSDLGQMMLCFESWKFRQLAARERENGRL